jgi:magnesium transporter
LRARSSGVVRAVDHLERRQLGIAASTLVIRAMALGEVRLMDWWRVAASSPRPGARQHPGVDRLSPDRHLVGVLDHVRRALAARCDYRVAGAGRHRALGHAGRRAAAAILRRLGFDPATLSAPFVATLVDVTG